MDPITARHPAVPEPIDADHEPGGLALAFPLIALAGWVDAIGMIQWHGLYVSFMSGNSMQFGASPAAGDWNGTWEAGRAVLVFVAGAVAGELIGPAGRSWRSPVVVGAEAALLWLALASALGGWGQVATASLTGFAMGLQTAAVHNVDGTSIALTYVTGTLVSLGRGIAAALRGAAPWRGALPFVGCWLCFVLGAAAGSFVARTAVADALGGAAAVATAMAVLSAVGAAMRRRTW